MALRAVLFDAYGTLFDVYSVAVAADGMFPGHGQALSLVWREKQIDYTRLVSMGGRYQPFWDLTRAGLRYAALRLGLDLTPAAEQTLMSAYCELGTFPENHGVLAALEQRGIPAGILSNGDPDMLGAAVRSARLEPLLQHVISVHGTRRYKPDPVTYALGPAALQLPASEILFVSSNCWDAIGATWFGYTTLWVNRSGAPLEQLGTEPSHTGRSLRDVLPLFSDTPLP